MNVAGEVANDFAIIAKGISPRGILVGTDHCAAENIAGVDKGVMGSCPDHIYLTSVVK